MDRTETFRISDTVDPLILESLRKKAHTVDTSDRNMQRNTQYAVWLESEVGKLLSEETSDSPWSMIDREHLPRQAYLWVEDSDDPTTWYLPYREGTGGIDPDTKMFKQAGAVNLGALRAIQLAMIGAASGKNKTIPAQIRSKIKKLLKKYKIGQYKEQVMNRPNINLEESSVGTQFAGAELDKENCIVKNVAVLRPLSKNTMLGGSKQRRYSTRALEAVARMLNSAKSYIDHPTKSEVKDRDGVRSIKDILGYYSGGRLDEAAVVRGDLHYLKHHGVWLEPLVEQMSDKIGNSIHATGDLMFDKASQEEVVEDVRELASVDLVTSPAATKNLFESMTDVVDDDTTEDEMDPKEITLTMLTESRPDLIATISEAVKADLAKVDTTKQLQEQIDKLTTENSGLKKTVDENAVKEAAAQHEVLVSESIADSKLDAKYVTDAFKESLRKCDDKDGMKVLVDDRKKLVESQKGGVKHMGTETDLDESKHDGDDTPDADAEKEFSEALPTRKSAE